MRRAARVDTASADIERALKQIGASVEPKLSRIGQGVPDLLVGWRGRNVLLEVKTGTGKLTTDETQWSEKWAGQYAVVRTPDEAIDAVLNTLKTS